mmetsp:Transcript_37202/g.100575  ORF Transcript_37202/g.100575 Transcript_37202/m.100575 type:complete len:675 (-) Transcript_37202:82-2106(-)|eukprot:CAMPEP_0119473482 /NCGR_PEP_ID=MMETSP1344-20130328/5118_1 /TAXON_ID=236787 /ORGANISM="Florenciella parvula, Strain CCMP2471" /LENGTH=674 /DNA_ID=CAMNT_0007506601 /DNA_START=160 /DNA_END=2184 /DNA_ORIENTATION=-
MAPRLWALALAAAPAVFAAAGNGWVDPDTPEEALTVTSEVDGSTFDLVYSDEFEVDDRSFDDGHDPAWTALEKDDYTNGALHYYSATNVQTRGGVMNITTSAENTKIKVLNKDMKTYKTQTKHFKSGMVQTWNKFCFTGGIVEVRAALPGLPNTGGLWPAIWLMGNLARATYVGSSDWVWPWSYDTCNRKIQKQQLISKCNPNPHYEMGANVGRGAPEIDILEAMPGWELYTLKKGVKGGPPGGHAYNLKKPYISTSLQMAPGIDGVKRPKQGFFPDPGTWYEGQDYGYNTSMNIFFFGNKNEKPNEEYSYQSDAISANTQLTHEMWSSMQTYKVEWQLPESDPEGQGYIRWYINDRFVHGMGGEVVGAKNGAVIPSEPMYVILNTAMSSTWGFPTPCPSGCKASDEGPETCACYDCNDWNCKCGFAGGFCDSLPAHFMVDFVRVYQNSSDPLHKVGCSTPERPTHKWIEGHLSGFMGDDDEIPLQPLVTGGAPCDTAKECGGLKKGRGTCDTSTPPNSRSTASDDDDGWSTYKGTCVCEEGWMGPACRTHHGEDPIIWFKEQKLGFDYPNFPGVLKMAVSLMAAVLIATIITHVLQMRRVDVLGYTFKPGIHTLGTAKPRGGMKRSAASYGMPNRETTTDSGVNLSGLGRKQYSIATRPSEVHLSRMIDDDGR